MTRAAIVATCALLLVGCRGASAPGSHDLIDANDYLVGDDALRDKPVEAPLGSLKRQVEGGAYYAIGDAVELFTKYAWRSRPATDADLVSGAPVACFLSKAASAASCANDVQRGPRTRAEAFTRQWVIAPLKARPNGSVVIVDGCRCDVAGVRLVLP